MAAKKTTTKKAAPKKATVKKTAAKSIDKKTAVKTTADPKRGEKLRQLLSSNKTAHDVSVKSRKNGSNGKRVMAVVPENVFDNSGFKYDAEAKRYRIFTLDKVYYDEKFEKLHLDTSVVNGVQLRRACFKTKDDALKIADELKIKRSRLFPDHYSKCFRYSDQVKEILAKK